MTKARSKSEEKGIRILDSAVELFTEQGFASTSMDQIAKRAGVSKQTVYSHHGSKEELFVAAVGCKCTFHQMTQEEFEPGPDLRAQLLNIAQNFAALVTSREAIQVARTCTSEAETYPELSRLFFEAGPDRVISRLSRLLAEFDRNGELCIPEPRFAAVQLLKMVEGEQQIRLNLNVEGLMPEAEYRRYVTQCVDAFLRAYAP
ncbi:TetR family transcriptional regulator [Marinobacterium nitratireducens]|uniref:TetR family transcriptional regulator n=1 Tax=Marinobacterium nitratireducens TaxID=518897 RepID=A0A918DU97_9GAMM|nr:TetR/AcrR family transcriptional regulator [Marinobacterium nitratireducens]GGO83516.1 TetR family transcriptional regulator [Marinobacterium nitratireducens]